MEFTVDKEKVFTYLDNLRESGITNMFGSAPYVAEEFDVNIQEARELVSEWMRTFSERHPIEEE